MPNHQEEPMLNRVTDEVEPEVTVLPDGSVMVPINAAQSIQWRTRQAFLDWCEEVDRAASLAFVAHARRHEPRLIDLDEAAGF